MVRNVFGSADQSIVVVHLSHVGSAVTAHNVMDAEFVVIISVLMTTVIAPAVKAVLTVIVSMMIVIVIRTIVKNAIWGIVNHTATRRMNAVTAYAVVINGVNSVTEILVALSALAVSYTHLTLPTN